MSDDRSKPYNLRSKRTSAGASEGFVTASELIRLNEERSGVVHQETQREAASSDEMVSDIPPNNDDEGGSQRPTEEPSTAEQAGDQGLPDSSGEAQGQQQSPPHRPLVEQEAKHDGQEVLRLRLQVRNTKTHKVEYVWVPINMLI